MTPRDTFGTALRHALATRDRARRWGNRAHADATFSETVMDAADTYADARVAEAMAAGELKLRSRDDEITVLGRAKMDAWLATIAGFRIGSQVYAPSDVEIIRHGGVEPPAP